MDFIVSRYPSFPEEFETFFDSSESAILKPSAFNQAFEQVDLTKTPGSPLVFVFPTNQKLPEIFGELKLEVERRLVLHNALGREVWKRKSFTSTLESNVQIAAALVARGITDPVLVGFKGEPRKKGKVPRLVSQVSVVVNLEARLIHGNHLRQEQTYDDIPTVTRLDLTTPSETAAMHHRLSSHGALSTSDVQGWEYSVNEDDRWAAWTKEAVGMQLMTPEWTIVPGKERHFFTLLGFHYCLIHRVVQLPEGDLLVPPAGQMSSGELGTFSENSFMRANISNLVSLATNGQPVRYVLTGGDDCLDTNADASDDYLSFGKVITDYAVSDSVYNFCSTQFHGSHAFQENIEKSSYAACVRKTFNAEDELSYDTCFKYHPRYEEFRTLVQSYVTLGELEK